MSVRCYTNNVVRHRVKRTRKLVEKLKQHGKLNPVYVDLDLNSISTSIMVAENCIS